MVATYRSPVDTPIGVLTLVASDVGLRRVLWPGEGEKGEGAVVDDRHPVLVAAATQLVEYFAGDRRRFDLPLDLVGTGFQKQAWSVLAEVPYGETRSYGEQARGLGRPGASRAVGAANAKNPVPIVLPCHRIVGSDGSITGFAGGIERKQRLLALEGYQQSLDL